MNTISGYWIILDKDYENLEKKVLSSNKYLDNTVKPVEEEVILDLVKIIQRNTERMNKGIVVLCNDNVKLIKGLSQELQKVT